MEIVEIMEIVSGKSWKSWGMVGNRWEWSKIVREAVEDVGNRGKSWEIVKIVDFL